LAPVAGGRSPQRLMSAAACAPRGPLRKSKGEPRHLAALARGSAPRPAPRGRFPCVLCTGSASRTAVCVRPDRPSHPNQLGNAGRCRHDREPPMDVARQTRATPMAPPCTGAPRPVRWLSHRRSRVTPGERAAFAHLAVAGVGLLSGPRRDESAGRRGPRCRRRRSFTRRQAHRMMASDGPGDGRLGIASQSAVRRQC
jgi:hypothetical protein